MSTIEINTRQIWYKEFWIFGLSKETPNGQTAYVLSIGNLVITFMRYKNV